MTITDDPKFKEYERLVAELVVEARTGAVEALAASPRFPDLERAARRLFRDRWNVGLTKLAQLVAEVEATPRVLGLLVNLGNESGVDRAEVFRRARLLGAALVPTVVDSLIETGASDRN
ncbi:MAG: hypothetical protein AB1730_26825 [Myxococcota bacterium]